MGNIFAVNFVTVLLLLTMCSKSSKAGEGASDWNYDNTTAWGVQYPQCNGKMQSPIDLNTGEISVLPRLTFYNYNKLLPKPLTLENNGHSVNLNIPALENGKRAFLTIDNKSRRDFYEAMSLHFHWGSLGVKGSEHMINGQRYDAELHIVHKNKKYDTMNEATQNADGITVLGIMLQSVENPERSYPSLNKIFNKISNVVQYKSKVTLNGQISLRQILGDLNTSEFYIYNGSLTTPPCAEAVTWFVFPNALAVENEQLENFWKLLDPKGQPLINNFRPIQERGDRIAKYHFGIGSYYF